MWKKYFVICFRALAKNCKAPLDSKKGGDSGKCWKEGKPVRVVRNCKGRKHSEYAPEEGNRYDGIYKVRGNLLPHNSVLSVVKKSEKD